ncbi:hypothetical protein [Nocardia sp. BMG111209]|uniref:hypothetical protein n=1 Tax=Nocardia sp. BMG111209 TaxID=1160137 RepID=UPI000370E2CA|nr:hypothetical protein [Nocardia sp. BMG111209]
MTPWTFGDESLPEQRAFAAEVRALAAVVLGLEHAEPELREATQVLAGVRRRLAAIAPADRPPRVGDRAGGDGRLYLDHGQDVGAFNPMFPVYDITIHGPERASGTVNFPICYEGPPGCAHGGFLAVFADSVVQHHNCAVGSTGKTRGLQMRYRRPVPLSADLPFEIERTMAEGRIASVLRLLSGPELLCEARIEVVRGDRSALPAISARRGNEPR